MVNISRLQLPEKLQASLAFIQYKRYIAVLIILAAKFISVHPSVLADALMFIGSSNITWYLWCQEQSQIVPT